MAAVLDAFLTGFGDVRRSDERIARLTRSPAAISAVR
jgi:hypothetical protein